jgi:hypothetical protein
MVDILVQGGDAASAAAAMRAAVREIFEADPIQSTTASDMPGRRSLAELGLIILGIPPASSTRRRWWMTFASANAGGG